MAADQVGEPALGAEPYTVQWITAPLVAQEMVTSWAIE